MKKEEIRKEFFKLRIQGHSYPQCRKLLKAQFNYDATIRTLQRWTKRLNQGKWDLKDKSTRPKNIHYKINAKIEKEVVELRKKTGWGENKIANFFQNASHKAINKILNKHNLCRASNSKGKRIKYIQWQRQHPNSLWQIDISDQKVAEKYLIAIIDDCSRYCIELIPLKQISTAIITAILDQSIKKHGKPREILTDNGSVFGLRSKHSKFDRWCRRRGIKHIRTSIHSPTTTGKVERLFQTLIQEIEFCNKDLGLFRMRYNHFRPHLSLDNKAPSEIYFAFHKLF